MGKAGAKLRKLGQRGMTTAEYAVGTVAAVTGVGAMVGFFGNGEISHNRLYGYTGVLTLFL